MGCCCKKSDLQTPLNTSSTLAFKDRLGSFKARMGISRMNYAVTPGLYRLNQPNADSPVLVTANYKLTFDALRKELSGLNLWILVLDTGGINVWCAAGKGTFGTKELASKIESSGLADKVHHRKIILPQLGAVGVCAHDIKKQTGFEVIYGPVQAKDLPEFLHSGLKKSPDMRQVPFGFKERAVLIPIELLGAKWVVLAGLILGILLSIFTGERWLTRFQNFLIPLFLSVGSGAVLTPLFLPLIPFRSFALKGLNTAGVVLSAYGFYQGQEGFKILTEILLFTPVSSFLALNFTGASTYTSLAGVKKEMRRAIPLLIIMFLTGLVLKIIKF